MRSWPPCRSRTGAVDLRGVEAPRRDVGQVVVDQPARAAATAGPTTSPSHAQSPERGQVGRGELRVVLGAEPVLLLRRAPGGGGAQRGRAGGAMPANQSRPSAPNGARPATLTTASDPAGQQRGAGQGVRAAAGVAHDREPVDAQRVGDRGDVGGGRRHVPARARGVEPP